MTINMLDSTNLNGEKYAIIELDIQNIYDVINGLNTIVANKEDEINELGPNGADNNDLVQLARFKKALKEMQFVKANVK